MPWRSRRSGKACGSRGFAGLPTFHRANSLQQYMFVNGRPLKDPLVSGALRAAYADVLARDRYPVAALFIELSPSEVDVNVHPAKLEVRFRDPGLVRGLIIGAVRSALAEEGFRAASTGGAATLAALRPQATPPHRANGEWRAAGLRRMERLGGARGRGFCGGGAGRLRRARPALRGCARLRAAT